MQKGVKFDQDKTVEELGLEDKTSFIGLEKHATLEQLLLSRSGIDIRSGNQDNQHKLNRHGSPMFMSLLESSSSLSSSSLGLPTNGAWAIRAPAPGAHCPVLNGAKPVSDNHEAEVLLLSQGSHDRRNRLGKRCCRTSTKSIFLCFSSE